MEKTIDRKFFGSTRYVRLNDDIQEDELYISCDVVSMWDWCNKHHRWVGKEFTYRVFEQTKDTVGNYVKRRYLSPSDLTESELKQVMDYIKS